MIDAPAWLWLLLSALLGLSGLCSASEAALFSLTPAERDRSSRSVRELLERPKDLLVTVLLVNLVVNILFFAFADRLFEGGPDGAATTETASVWRTFANVFGALLTLLVFGEILPKTLALRSRVRLSAMTAPGWRLASGGLGPLRRWLVRLMDTFGGVTERGEDERVPTAGHLGSVLEQTAKAGEFDAREASLLAEIVELGGMRVREIMTPRVDGLYLDQDGSNREEVVTEAVEQRMSWLPVIAGTADEIRGSVRTRDLLRSPGKGVTELVMPVLFVPEVASCLDLLALLRERRATEAVCVDEWGGTAGYVTVEDVFEELVGELRVEGEAREQGIVPLGEGAFQVPGWLSIRDWNERFGMRVVPTEFETVGGLVTALLGRIPRDGDSVRYGHLAMDVGEVRGRRIQWVRLRVEQSPGGVAKGLGDER